jgi:hypothetical protein
MKIITRAVFQMTAEGFELLEETSFEHTGEIAECKGGGTAPAAPDPAVQTNVEAAANRYNTTGPSGSVNWDQGPVEIIGYDAKGNPQYGNHWTQSTTLNPNEQHQYDARGQIATQLLDSANNRIPEFADHAFSFDSATPEVAKAQYAKNMELLEPEFKKATDSWEQRMANQGLPVGSEAYSDAQHQLDQDQNQARSSAAYDAVTYGNQLSQTERQQNYNELAAALGSNQVNTPTAGAFTPIDAAGAYDKQYQSQLAGFNADQAQRAQNQQSATALGGAAIAAFF